MNTLSNYDFIFEVGNNTLQKLIQAALHFDLVQANPPFEFYASLPSGNMDDDLHCIVHQVSLNITSQKEMDLIFSFHNSSVAMPGLKLLIGALDGKIKITITPELINGSTASHKCLAFNFSNAKVALTLSGEAQKKINNALKEKNLSNVKIENDIVQSLVSYFRLQGIRPTPMEFKVIPGTTGQFSPEIQFEQLELSCIPNQDVNKQALFFGGIFLPDNHGKGNLSLKTFSDITPGKDVVAAISPECFHKLIICQKIGEELLPQPFANNISSLATQMPPDCGLIGGIKYEDGLYITKIQSNFVNGAINLHLELRKEGFCYEAIARQDISILLEMDGPVLKPKLQYGKPSLNVSVPWYCYVAGGFVFSFIVGYAVEFVIGLILKIILENVLDVSANKMSLSSQKIILGGKSQPTFNKVYVKADALVFEGNLYIQLEAPQIPKIEIALAHKCKNQSTKSGVFHSKFCVVGDVNFEITKQIHYVSCRAMPVLMGRPLILKWHADAGLLNKATSVPFAFTSVGFEFKGNPDSGILTILNAPTHYPEPLPDGSLAEQDVSVAFQLSGNWLHFDNSPAETNEEGNYVIFLNLEAQDPLGNLQKAGCQYGMDRHFVNTFDFEQKLADCLYKLAKKFKADTFKARRPKLRVEFPPVDHPDAEIIKGFYESVGQFSAPEADAIRSHTALLFGPYFYKALHEAISRKNRAANVDAMH